MPHGGGGSLSRLGTAVRLLKGTACLSAGRRIAWARRREALDHVDLVSADVFGTLLQQAPGLDDAVLRVAGCELVRACRAEGLPIPFAEDHAEASLARRLATMRQRARTEGGLDREVPLYILFRTIAVEAGAGERAEAMADAAMRCAIEWHHRWTRPDAKVIEFLSEVAAAGLRVVAVSDTTLRSVDLASLLRAHGIKGLDGVYASCDGGGTKFHGSLFCHVMRSEGVAPGHVLHFGDNWLTDVASPRAFGIRAIFRLRRTTQPTPDPRHATDPAYRVGWESLGPIIGAFSRSLLRDARRNSLQRLAFVSRDGWLLMEATVRLAQSAGIADPPRMDYVHFSRRSTALPALRQLDAATVATVSGIRADGSLADRVLAYLGLENSLPTDLAEYLRQLGDDALSLSMASNARLALAIDSERARQTDLLAAYLRQVGLYGAHGAALVDVGWRATIQASLNRIFDGCPGWQPLAGRYIGLWSEERALSGFGALACGLLGDSRRGRGLLEGAAWQMALVFEAVCRAPHGTVAGYRYDGSLVVPTLMENVPSRDAECAQEPHAESIRAGILDRVAAIGVLAGPSLGEPRLARLRAQARCLRLAYIPQPEEIRVLGVLEHTESHANFYHLPLVLPDRVPPWRAPRRWLAGLSSPWRAGYVAATGGLLLAVPFALAELLLSRFPMLRTWLEHAARRLAGVRPL